MLVHALFPILSLLFSLVSAQSPARTTDCPVGYFCGYGSAGPQGTTAFTFGPATATLSTIGAPAPSLAPGVFQADDTDPRFAYSPPLLWSPQTVGCVLCPIGFNDVLSPPPFNRTWHQGTRTSPEPGIGPLTATFNFTGTGISVFAILPATQLTSNTQYFTSVSFLIDGAATTAPNWTVIPPQFSGLPIKWSQQKIFENLQLPSGDHGIEMIGSTQGWSMFMLDYVEYYTEAATSSSLPSSAAAVTLASGAQTTDVSNVSSASLTGSALNPVATHGSNDASRNRNRAYFPLLSWVFVCGTSVILFL